MSVLATAILKLAFVSVHHRDKLVNVLLGEWVTRLVPGIHIADRVKIDDGIPFRLAVRRAARSNAGSQGVPLLPDGGGPIGGPVAALPGEQRVQRIRVGKAVGAALITKEMGRLDFTKTAAELDRLIRGLTPWPSERL